MPAVPTAESPVHFPPELVPFTTVAQSRCCTEQMLGLFLSAFRPQCPVGRRRNSWLLCMDGIVDGLK